MKEELKHLTNEDGSEIALWKTVSSTSSPTKNILLTHGTFSNRKVLNGIVEYLVEHQYTCWVFEWRNHGHSKKSDSNFDFETIGKQDFKTVFDYLFNTCKIPQINCITHSGGGICLTIALIEYPIFKNHINSITMFACQAFGAGSSLSNYLKIAFGKYLSKIIGKVPAKSIGGEEDESYYFMQQWFNWNLRGKFEGKTGIDYQSKMKEIKTPILSVHGAGDHFISPPDGCRKYLHAFQNSENQLLFCSTQKGYVENYNHSRILHSRNSRKEIYPKVLAWMQKHDATN